MDRKEIEEIFDEKFKKSFLIFWTIEAHKKEIKDFFFDTILPEVLRGVQFDGGDIQRVWDHYWGWDYSPSFRELNDVAFSMNLRLLWKAKQKYNITL